MSIWWIVGAFMLGASAGMLLLALMNVAAIDHSGQTADPEDPGPPRLHL